MAYDKKNLESLLAKLEVISGKATALEEKHADDLKKLHPKYIESARNMIHYLALRQVDIRLLQQKLGYSFYEEMKRAPDLKG